MNNPKISILCPSRGRPHLAKKMIDSSIETAGVDLEILLYLNNDDPTLSQYKDMIDSKYYQIGSDRSPCYSWNLLAEQSKSDILFLMGDDGEFITENWGEKIIKAFDRYPDKIACVYPNTGGAVSKHKNPHFCLHKNWVDTLGYFVPPQFWHWYVDTWTAKIAQGLNRYYLVNDMTVTIQTRVNDDTEARTSYLCNRERDHWLWQKTQRYLDNDVKLLKKFIKGYK
jgi:hypothetical protein